MKHMIKNFETLLYKLTNILKKYVQLLLSPQLLALLPHATLYQYLHIPKKFSLHYIFYVRI